MQPNLLKVTENLKNKTILILSNILNIGKN